MWKRPKLLFPIAAALLILGLFLFPRQLADDRPREDLGLMTSLPIYWGEGSDIASLAAGDTEMPWVRIELEQRYNLQPFDSLSADAGFDPQQTQRLIVAQPRALSPQDNVDLDSWVNAGGRLLIVIDPLLTGHYSVPFTDPRHPVAVGLVPPVLERWGLGIQFDERQPLALQEVEIEGMDMPYAMAGAAYQLESGSGQCEIFERGLIARCDVGQGRVTLLTDAALFEAHEATGDLRKSLESITEFAFE